LLFLCNIVLYSIVKPILYYLDYRNHSDKTITDQLKLYLKVCQLIKNFSDFIFFLVFIYAANKFGAYN